MKMMQQRHKSNGFTLIELIISVVILGILIAAVAPLVSSAFMFMEAAKKDENEITNRNLANAMIDFSRTRTGVMKSRLPDPVNTSAPIVAGLFNEASTNSESIALGVLLKSTGVGPNQINFDNAVVQNARVYQRVSDLTFNMPLYVTTGPSMRLTYDYAVVYSTRCGAATACYTSASSSNPPGDSPVLNSGNYSSWKTVGSDYGAVAFSSLSEQKNLLRITAGRLNMLTERFNVDFHNKVRLSSADSATNFFPTNNGGLDLGNTNPVANMGCRDGWYTLSAANVDVLTQLGLDKSEYGVTPWGGIISYCRDYDPAGTGTHNSPPHYGALRINKGTTSLGVPAVISDAAILTF
ncbi:hypothetical protein LCGC14_0328020 [marine sediment metagenome]|uniref:Prepilin-type N-terminal cleavage/methylation domain-containing protein n=1 Tax=marine sediment metagenome TaxID=412755 RepID=A0A0F9WPE4_9ZZZZ